MSFVLDASLTLSWLFEDEKNDYAEAVKASLRRTDAAVPVLWPVEVANGLVVAHQRKRLSLQALVRAPQVLARLPIRVDRSEPSMPELIGLAREQGLSAYDALYLRLAVQKALPIATLDKRLGDACRAVGIPRFEP